MSRHRPTLAALCCQDGSSPQARRRGGGWPFMLAALLLTSATAAQSQERVELRVTRTRTPPRIDGALDDESWRGDPLPLGQWLSYNPTRGDAGPETTDVRITYDDRFIYIGFACRTATPGRIRTTVSRRDTVFSDDWIGLSLDSTNTGQTAYHLMVNPSGIQMDAINTTAAGEQFDADFLWYSAGQRTSDGYSVELALPVQSIRFPRGPNTTMGILFWRHVSSSGISYAWPDLKSGEWVFDRHARLVFPDLAPRRLLELLPSATFATSQTRRSPSEWNPADRTPDVGFSGKYGLTSQITIDGTVNPDFSQVESDAFQVEVNQRFPVFFSEKRPFFMEGQGLFSVAGTGGGDYNMRSAVHTRRIVNPAWGAKLTGTVGSTTFGLLESRDDSPLPLAGEDDSTQAAKLFSIGRLTYSLGGSNYVGAIVTDTQRSGRRNRVLGADLSWKPSSSQTISATFLHSQTSTTAAARDSRGTASQITYRLDTHRFLVAPQIEHYDRGFEMDTAFYNRTGFTSAFVYSEVNFYPKAAERWGVIRLHPLVVARRGEDRVQGGDEGFLVTGIAINTKRQGFFRVQHGEGHEHWSGQRFRTGDPFGAFGGLQVFRWLNVGFNVFRNGWSTFYDSVAPYQGRSNTGGIDLNWQPGEHFNQTLSYNVVRFRRADSGASVFRVNIVNLKTVYQFDRHALVRWVAQYDSSRTQWLSDLLASYEFVPGTALHAGYGSIYEQRALTDEGFVRTTGRYLNVNRGFFFKASYLHRF